MRVSRSGVGLWTAIFLALFALATGLQVAAGAFQGDLAGYPDEAAHYVTALMLHDYAVSGLGRSPMEYARDYYVHYPKVAFGHWPPVFYVVQAVWMLMFTASKTSVLVLMAVLAAAVAAVLCWRVSRRYGLAAGLIVGGVYVALPVVQEHTSMVMAEGLLTLFCFLAAISFGEYLESENWRACAWFGVFTSLAILTKGNAWALLLVPPAALLVTGKWRLLRSRTLLLTTAAIFAACLPWQLLTLHLAVEGWDGEAGLAYTATALPTFIGRYAGMGGVLVLGLAVVGMIVAFRRWSAGRGEWAAMLALIVATLVFHSVVPAGVETRKLMTAAPALLLFALAGAAALLARVRASHAVAAASLAAVFAIQAFTVPVKPARGFAEAATMVVPSPHLAPSVTLVSSDASGEGAFISEVAMRDARPNQIVLRASKVLGKESWGGDHYESRFPDVASLERFLDESPVESVVIDSEPVSKARPHHVLVMQAMQANTKEWVRVETAKFVQVYRRITSRKLPARDLRESAQALMASAQ